MNASSRTPSSKNSPIRSTSRVAALLLLVGAAASAAAESVKLTPISSRDQKIVRRWVLPGDPRGLAAGSDGTLYVGLATPQAVVAVNPKSGEVLKRVVLDSAEIASTKELVTLRTDRSGKRLFIANGSDESATILSLPNLGVLREITMEGEVIRDIVPDPRGRYIYLLGRRVHVFDNKGQTALKTLEVADPMALAVSDDGAMLAVTASEDFGNTRATVAILFNANDHFAEVARDPMQTESAIHALMFANGGRSLIGFSNDRMYEKPLVSRAARMSRATAGGEMRMTIDFGSLVNSTHVCMPDGSGPQVATLAGSDTFLVYAERRCSASGAFSGSQRRVTPASLYGVNAYAVAFDPSSNTIAATDRDGFLTIYKVPRAVTVSF